MKLLSCSWPELWAVKVRGLEILNFGSQNFWNWQWNFDKFISFYWQVAMFFTIENILYANITHFSNIINSQICKISNFGNFINIFARNLRIFQFLRRIFMETWSLSTIIFKKPQYATWPTMFFCYSKECCNR